MKKIKVELKKLKLNKEKIITLSQNHLNVILGGGYDLQYNQSKTCPVDSRTPGQCTQNGTL
jgi:natural product precursor